MRLSLPRAKVARGFRSLVQAALGTRYLASDGGLVLTSFVGIQTKFAPPAALGVPVTRRAAVAAASWQNLISLKLPTWTTVGPPGEPTTVAIITNQKTGCMDGSIYDGRKEAPPQPL